MNKPHPLQDLRVVAAIAVGAGILLAIPRIVHQAATGHPELAVAHFFSGILSGLFCVALIYLGKKYLWR